MAKRSDFAQKLLDDLRVRKEKMAAPQTSNNRSNSTAAMDAYAYSKQAYRGRGDTRTNGTSGSRAGNPQLGSRGSSRTPVISEASNQIVAYGGGGRGTEQIGDLSMALVFALENGAKLGRTDSSSRNSMLGFLGQFGIRKMERKGSVNRGSMNQFPNLSHLHIEEISRGAQKLNQILKACSNGINVDRFSIEIGKELMKGAMDLEESLRMLVNLQEASEFMVSSRSQRKNRITLLDEDEDDDEEENSVNLAEQKQLDLPRFSFDKNSRHARKIHEVVRRGLKQMVTQGKVTTSASVSQSQRQSISYGPGVKNLVKASEQKESKPEKDRIPNVIAKLMGLNELPKNEEFKQNTQKDLSSKPKREMRAIGQTMQESSRAAIKPEKQQTFPQTIKPDKPVARDRIEGELVVQGKMGLKEIRVQSEKQNGSKVVPINQQKLQNNHEVQLTYMPRKSDSPQQPYMPRKSDSPQQPSMPRKSDSPQQPYMPRKSDSPQQPSMPRKSDSPQQPYMPRKSDSPDLKRRGEVKEQQKLKTRKQQGSVISNAVQKKQPQIEEARLNKTNMVRSKSSADSNFDTQDFSPRYPDPEGPEPEKERFGTPQKVKSRRVNKSEMPRRIDEVATRRNGTLNNLTKPVKHQVAHKSHNGAEKFKANRLKKSEPHIIKSNKSKASIQRLDLAENLQKETEQSSTLQLHDLNEVECRRLQVPQIPLANESCQNSVSIENHDHQLDGSYEDSLDISYTEQLVKPQKTSNWRKQEPLTESENHLKQIVIKSQLFLNTAEALFNLDIPFGILHDSRHDCSQDGDSKLTLDCGYEVMKRKGRRQELNVHPNCVKISISFTKIQSLDELVQHLSKDFEKIKRYGKNGKLKCEAEEYVPKMLEFDVHNLEPDMNCMWDMGWDETMFAILEVDEVVKDLERLVLSSLVDELTRDLYHM